MKYHTLFFFRKFGKILPNLPSAAAVISALRVKQIEKHFIQRWNALHFVKASLIATEMVSASTRDFGTYRISVKSCAH